RERLVDGGVDGRAVVPFDLPLDRYRERSQRCFRVSGDVLIAGKERDHAGYPGLLDEPVDLLVAADPTMLETVASDSLRDGQSIGDDPNEVTGLQARDHLCHFG